MSNKVKPTVKKLINSIASAEWMANCGKSPPAGWDSRYVFVDKVKAKKSLLTSRWENTFYEASNGCSEALPEEELDRWNDVILPINDLVKKYKESALSAVCSHFSIPPSGPLENIIGYSLAMPCLELEYEPFLGPGFFNEVCALMLAGRLPCGLTKPFPNGQLMVY